MIAIIERKIYDHSHNEPEIDYEIHKGFDITGIRKLLTDEQIANLKAYGNTCLSYKIYKQLTEEEILYEVERLTGSKCEIIIKKHKIDSPSVIIKVKKRWYFRIKIRNKVKDYILYSYNKEHYHEKASNFKNFDEFIEKCIEMYEIEKDTYEINRIFT